MQKKERGERAHNTYQMYMQKLFYVSMSNRAPVIIIVHFYYMLCPIPVSCILFQHIPLIFRRRCCCFLSSPIACSFYAHGECVCVELHTETSEQQRFNESKTLDFLAMCVCVYV